MKESTIAVAPTNLTAHEIAVCLRNGVELLDLAVVFWGPAAKWSEYTDCVLAAFDRGYQMVWSLDTGAHALTVDRCSTHPELFLWNEEIEIVEFPMLRCVATDFFRMLGYTDTPKA